MGRERVPQLMRVDMAEACCGGDAFDDPADAVTIENSTVVKEQPARGWMLEQPIGEEPGGVGVHRDQPVVVEFADRDPQPGCAVELHDRVMREGAELAGAHPGS